jgi:hypothetical protein
MVRRGILFRSSEPSQVTDAGAAQLSQQLGIKIVYDLRSAVEIARGMGAGHGFPLREWEGSDRKFVPVFLDQDYSPEALALRYKNYAAESDEVSHFKSSCVADVGNITAASSLSCLDNSPVGVSGLYRGIV